MFQVNNKWYFGQVSKIHPDIYEYLPKYTLSEIMNTLSNYSNDKNLSKNL